MATQDELREWCAEARCFAVRAVSGYLQKLGTPNHTARDHADEAVQESLPRLLARCDPARYQEPRHFYRAAARTAIRQAIVNHRRRTRQQSHSTALSYDPADPRSVDEDWTDDCSDTLRAALAELPPDDREMLLMKDVEGLTLAVIASHFGLTISQVWERLKRIRAHLRNRITDDEIPG